MKNITIVLAIIIFGLVSSQQSNVCNLKKSELVDALKVDSEDAICISKNSAKPYTIFYTFASWCEPCRIHLEDFLKFQENAKTDSYIILVEGENDPKLAKAISFIKQKSATVKILVLKNEKYGKSVRKRNAMFIEEITPKKFENIDDLSKFILVKNNGEILYVTNWKDYNKDWKNSESMLKRTIYPLLE